MDITNQKLRSDIFKVEHLQNVQIFMQLDLDLLVNLMIFGIKEISVFLTMYFL